MIDLYKLTNGKNVYLEEKGERIEIDDLEIRFDKTSGFTHYAKIDGEWYVINMTDDECKIIVEDKGEIEMKDEVKARLDEIEFYLRETSRRILEDMEKETGVALTKENSGLLISAYRRTLDMIEEHYDSKLKYEYLSKPNPLLSEEDIECIESCKGKGCSEVLAALREVTESEKLSKAIDLIVYGATDEELNVENVTLISAAVFDICIFMRLYNKGREEEFAEEMKSIINKKWSTNNESNQEK